jgi:hypothetical protein
MGEAAWRAFLWAVAFRLVGGCGLEVDDLFHAAPAALDFEPPKRWPTLRSQDRCQPLPSPETTKQHEAGDVHVYAEPH